MKILMLADPDSVHTEKWAKSLAERGLDIFIFGLTNYDTRKYKDHHNITVYSAGYNKKQFSSNSKDVSKAINYTKTLLKLRKIIKDFSPKIMHAHFASSYGLLGALAGFSPFVISCWGYDIVSFPKKSPIHRLLIKYNFRKADKILTTSNYMKEEVAFYSKKDVSVTPFGIDIEKFQKIDSKGVIFDHKDFVIGTVKSLEEEYGIEYLIKAFKQVKDLNEDTSLKLLIVGGGSLERRLKNLVSNLGIEESVVFTGKIKHDEVAKYHNMIDIPVYLSNYESFGVAVLESSSCSKPVVVSNVGGLPEIVKDGITGYVVPAQDPTSAAKVLQLLIKSENLRKTIGENGRNHVLNNYNWNDNVQIMLNIYDQLA